MQIAAMPSGFLMPLIFTGAIFFKWLALEAVPVMQYLTLVNPLVYINEALRCILNAGDQAMPFLLSIAGIVFFTILMDYYGMNVLSKWRIDNCLKVIK